MPTLLPDTLPEWPTQKVEAYKYTNLDRLASLELAPARSQLRHSPKLEGVTVSSLGAPMNMPVTPLTERALAAEDNSWLIEATGENTAPLELKFELGEYAGTAPRITLRLAANARLVVFEDAYAGAGSLTNQLWQIELAEDAQLCHVRMLLGEETATHLSTSAVKVGRNASYKLITLNTGAGLARYEPHITLAAPGADVSLTAINLLTNTQHSDVTSVMRHDTPHGTSRQMVRSVLAGHARGVYQGQIVVAPGAQKTSARQSSKALLLSNGAEMNTKPELEIYADDVQCAHGATTGSLDRMALYYLKARGIPEAQARALLVGGFIAEALDGVTHDSLRLRLEQQVTRFMERIS